MNTLPRVFMLSICIAHHRAPGRFTHIASTCARTLHHFTTPIPHDSHSTMWFGCARVYLCRHMRCSINNHKNKPLYSHTLACVRIRKYALLGSTWLLKEYLFAVQLVFQYMLFGVSIYYFVYVNRDDLYRIKSFKRICRYKVLEIAVSVRFMYKMYSNLTICNAISALVCKDIIIIIIWRKKIRTDEKP